MFSLKIQIIRLLIRSLSLLPLGLTQAIGAGYGLIGYLLKIGSAQATRINLQLCFPNMGSQQREAMVKRSLIETGKTTAEMGICWLRDANTVLKLIKKVHNEHLIGEAMAYKKGVVLLAPHIGNWELLNLYVVSRYPITALYQPPKIAELDNFVRTARGRAGSCMVPTNQRGVAKLLQALKRGEMVGILPDQEPPRKAGVFAPFFSVPALSMQLTAKLLKKTGARAIFGFARRLPLGKGFEIIFLPADEAIYSQDVQTSVTGLNRSIESCVEQAPEQYQWEYKRFKTGPEGKTRFYH